MIFIILYIYSYVYLCIYSPSYEHFKAFPLSKFNSETSFLYQLFKENSNFIVKKPCKVIYLSIFYYSFITYEYMYVCMYIHTYIYMYVWVYACICVCIYLCMLLIPPLQTCSRKHHKVLKWTILLALVIRLLDFALEATSSSFVFLFTAGKDSGSLTAPSSIICWFWTDNDVIIIFILFNCSFLSRLKHRLGSRNHTTGYRLFSYNRHPPSRVFWTVEGYIFIFSLFLNCPTNAMMFIYFFKLESSHALFLQHVRRPFNHKPESHHRMSHNINCCLCSNSYIENLKLLSAIYHVEALISKQTLQFHLAPTALEYI